MIHLPDPDVRALDAVLRLAHNETDIGRRLRGDDEDDDDDHTMTLNGLFTVTFITHEFACV